ncbi:hypothetical protein [Streptomyces chumphonensis]|uniref:hypothetical protein n=1 Tax=Streptomyces chumphonensis TaxID=1214925 RepID=UPI003D756ADC
MKRLALAWAGRTALAGRLGRGSRAVAAQLLDRTRAWVRRGYRDDLTGWKAAIGCWARAAVALGAIVALYLIARAVPWLMWLLTGAWLWAALRATRQRDKDTAEAPEKDRQAPPADAPDEHHGEALLRLLHTLIGDGPGVHLRTVLAHLQAEGHAWTWTVTDLRARVEAHGIPVQKVRERGSRTPTIGVRRADLVAPTAAPSPAEPEQAAETPATAA